MVIAREGGDPEANLSQDAAIWRGAGVIGRVLENTAGTLPTALDQSGRLLELIDEVLKPRLIDVRQSHGFLLRQPSPLRDPTAPRDARVVN